MDNRDEVLLSPGASDKAVNSAISISQNIVPFSTAAIVLWTSECSEYFDDALCLSTYTPDH